MHYCNGRRGAKFLLAAVVSAPFLFPQAASANLLLNGDFEGGVHSSTINGFTNNLVPNDWTPNDAFDFRSGFNQVVANGVFGSNVLQTGNLETDPTPVLSQTFSTTVGATYTVTFQAYDGGSGQGDPLAFLTVAVGAHSVTFDQSVASITTGSFTFVGAGSDTIAISAKTNPSFWYIDNLDVEFKSVAAVPEPSTWLMMLVGFAGLGFAAYRRKSKPALTAA